MLTKTKVISVLLAGLLLLSVLAGCNSGNKATPTGTQVAQNSSLASGTTEQASTEPAVKPKIKLFLDMAYTGSGNPGDPVLADEFFKFASEKLNIDFDVTTPPHNNYSDVLNTTIASGDLPDVFYGTNLPVLKTRGNLAPLDELINAQSDMLKSDDKYYDSVRMEGKVYCVPLGAPMTFELVFRKDILDKNGVNIPKTTDEFYSEMKKLVGKGSIPLILAKWTSYMQFFANSFGAYFGLAQDESGKWFDGMTTQQAKDCIAYLHKLYADGIIDKQFATNENSTMREGIFAGKAASMIYWTSYYGWYTDESKKLDPKAEIVMVPALKGPGGDGATGNSGNGYGLCISSKSTEKEAAMKFIKWYSFTQEGQLAWNFGVEGKAYTVENGVAKLTDAATNAGMALDFGAVVLAPIKIDFPFPPEVTQHIDTQYKLLDEAKSVMGPIYVPETGKSTAYDTKYAASKEEKINEVLTRIIMGVDSIDEGLKKYEAWFKSVDGDKVLEELNK